jgi:iron complex outermembrane receptor protein
MLITGRLVLALAAVLLPAAARALPSPVQDLANLSLEQLGDVRVTSVSLRSERLVDAPAAVFVISADDIHRSGAVSLAEALRLAPNLHVSMQYNTGYVISARGFSSNSGNKLLVLIDGRSVYTPLFSGVFWDAQDVPLEAIDRIEVISGPAGTLWGTNAVNGVINVITKRAGETGGTLASASAGNLRQDGMVRHGASVAGGAWRMYGLAMHFDETQSADGKPVDDDGHKMQAGFRADWDHGGQQITLQGDAYRARRGQPKPGMISVGVPFALGNIEISGGNLLGRWTRIYADGSQLQLQAYYDRTERVIPPTLSETLDIGDIQLQYALPALGRHALVVGAGYRYADDRVTNSKYVGMLPANLKMHWGSLFVQDTVTLSPALQLTAGLRLERNDYTGNELLPNVRLAWKATEDSILWGAVSRTVRAPSRLDRDIYVSPTPPHQLAGGPHFESEIARFFELGYRRQVGQRFSYSINLYRALYDKLHTLELGPTKRYAVFANGMEAATRGIELWGQYQVTGNWRVSAAATGMHQEFWLKPGVLDLGRSLDLQGQAPRNSFLLRSSWQIDERRDLDLVFRHVGKLWTPDVPNYEALDVRFAWRPRQGLELAVGGTNLLGPSHGEFYEEATRTEIDRGVYLKLTSSF